MKAVQAHAFGGPEVLQLDEIDDPVPGPGEVVVDIKAAGVNPADTYMRSGGYAMVPDLPYVPGGDAAGVVSAVGADVDTVSVGERVFINAGVGANLVGCYAEKALRRATDVFHLPDQISYAAGAAIGVPYTTAHYALFERGGARPGETVFIHGASGAVGTAAIQLAKRAGLNVIGSAGTARGRDLVTEQGADHVVDHTSDGYLEEVSKLTGGNGPALILEMLANVNLATDMEAVAKFGCIVIIGARGEVTINPRRAMMKDIDIRGVALWNASPDLVRTIMDDLIAGMTDGTLRPVIGREFALGDAANAHVAVLEPGAHGKIVLLP